ncbi:tetratricopeptide repeat protein [Hymenobacter sp. HDW8]|uniref:tetratricopeptide repeat protein n=1 Tax=Hymenobacter sp. HDW8 TaxID=2714932 RepID=UPI00140D612E|nr:tetratricopeptide repeat protein [Hymenobacter sp. HDW8]QIL77626.1 tetratricopeptide repeat protein [Hymenobacter sp. HDW8]
MTTYRLHYLLAPSLVLTLLCCSCQEKKATPSRQALNELNLRSGQLITCGPPNQQLGTLTFPISCHTETQTNFSLGLKLLHSFEYEEAEKVFAAIIRQQPTCPMAYWGVAMSTFHPLWTPPSEPELRKGANALAIAQALPPSSPKETAYIAALATFYHDWKTVGHRPRCLRFAQAMEKLAARYPDDPEATILYALALTAAADPADKSFAQQKKAGALLTALAPKYPNHPGIIHYQIHAYDIPELAPQALPAARKYAAVAPSSAHALHMPSHIFTRLGLWKEAIASNLGSVAAAKCYAEQAGLQGHWDEELHGLDYLMYAYLQEGNNQRAKQQWTYLQSITAVEPTTFKVAYAYAAIPARYVLENRQWQQAAALQLPSAPVPWEQFPWQEAIHHFARLMGAVHTDNNAAAQTEWQTLQRLENTLKQQKDAYKAQQVHVQVMTGEAWMQWQEGKAEAAAALMRRAAALEDSTEKHPVTPSEVLPARELLGDMLLAMNRPDEALAAYETNLQKHSNRFNGLYGAGLAAERAGNSDKARRYYQQLLSIAAPSATRPELTQVRRFLQSQPSSSTNTSISLRLGGKNSFVSGY